MTNPLNPILKASGYSSLTYSYKAFARVECGSYNNPNIGCNGIVDDGMAVYSLALMGYFTDDIRHSVKAIEIITAWSALYQQNTNSNARLVVSWATPWYVNSAEIFRYTNSGFSENEFRKFTEMPDKFLSYTLDETMPVHNWVQIELPYTKKMIVDTRPKNAAHWVSKWETLTHCSQLGTESFIAPDIIIEPTPKYGMEEGSSNHVYPNPSKRNFFIETTDAGVARFQIINTAWQLILKGKFEDRTVVDMTNCTPNFYFLTISSEKGSSTHKLLLN